MGTIQTVNGFEIELDAKTGAVLIRIRLSNTFDFRMILDEAQATELRGDLEETHTFAFTKPKKEKTNAKHR